MIGQENRQPTTASRYPWSAICHLTIRRERGLESTGTGWIIANASVATAAHNICHPIDGMATEILVSPGRDGPEPEYYDTVGPDGYYLEDEWLRTFDERYDYAVLRIHEDLGGYFSPFVFAVFPDDVLTTSQFDCSGYPIDRSHGTQWCATGVIETVDGPIVHHSIDTQPGQSGAPIFYVNDENRYAVAVAIHTAYEGHLNRARRIDNELYERMLEWRQ